MNEFSKETDGFFAKHFDRRISGAVSRVLLKTPVTPNQVTIAVTLLGVYAGYLFSLPGTQTKIAGSLIFLLTSILDGCDGEIARAKKQTSVLGGWLDLWGDNVVHMAVFYGLSRGIHKDTDQEVYLTLGWAAVVGTLVSASLASWQTWKKASQTNSSESLFTSVMGDAKRVETSLWKRRLTRWSDALARRDFIYGVVVLAFLGHLEWFLWALAIGVNVYAAVLMLLTWVTRNDPR
jgi:1L-myo-inositol 1-phosphate cytidylyltransferase / CDP-L-myo-inositol myo-inositolphosphotransferase